MGDSRLLKSWAEHRAQLERLREHVSSAPHASRHFRRMYDRLADPAEGPRIVAIFDYELREGGIDPRGTTVLDAGCGSGIYSVLFVLEGAAKIEAIDFMAQNVEALARLAEAFSLPILAQQGDAGAMRLPPESVDTVFCNEAISHFHDVPAFLAEAVRVLKPGGRLLIADWNNGANPWVRRGIHREWEESEIGPFRTERFEPGKTPPPYVFRRWMILRRRFPDLSDEEVFQLGLRTAGLGGAELEAAGREYVRTRELPVRSYRRGMSLRRPEDAQRHEEPVDPRELTRMLRSSGVEAVARAHFGLSRSPLLPLLNRTAAKLGELPLRFARKYQVYARKRG